MKLSVCLNTAREDYSILSLPKVHIFEHTIESLRQQTFKDFELVIADTRYKDRANYFVEHSENFPIKHVPIKPNIWLPKNLVAISTCKNTAILHASGEIIAFIDDCVQLYPQYLETVVREVESGFVVNSLFDCLDGTKIKRKDHYQAGQILTYQNFFNNWDVGIWNNIAMKVEDFENINGYDEMFDGSKCLEDGDLGIRVLISRKNIKRIGPPLIYQDHKPPFSVCAPPIKCPQTYWRICLNKYKFWEYKANTRVLNDDEMNFLKSCRTIKQGDICPYVGLPCNHINPATKKCNSAESDELMELYRHPTMAFSLKEQRKDIKSAIAKLAKQVRGE